MLSFVLPAEKLAMKPRGSIGTFPKNVRFSFNPLLLKSINFTCGDICELTKSSPEFPFSRTMSALAYAHRATFAVRVIVCRGKTEANRSIWLKTKGEV